MVRTHYVYVQFGVFFKICPKFSQKLQLKLLSDDYLCAEIARQAAQMKLMRKLEKQAMARAAKEARKQQGTPQLFLCVDSKSSGM